MIERINTNEVKREIGKYGYGGYPVDEAINLFAKKINELVDAFNKLNYMVHPISSDTRASPCDSGFIVPNGITQCGLCGGIFGGEHTCRLKDLVPLDKNNQLN